MLRNFALFIGLCLAIIALLSWPANGQQDFFGELFSKGSVSVGSDKVLHCQAFQGTILPFRWHHSTWALLAAVAVALIHLLAFSVAEDGEALTNC